MAIPSHRSSAIQDTLLRCRRQFLAVGLFSLCVNVLMLTSSLYMMQVYDRVLASGSTETLVLLTVIALGALGVMAALDAVRSRVLGRLGTWFEAHLAPEALSRGLEAALSDLPYRAEALRDLGLIRTCLTGPGMLALFDAPWVPVYIAAIYLIHPMLGHVAVAGALLLFALARLNEALTQRQIRTAGERAMAAARTAEALMRNAEVIDAMGLHNSLTAHWQQQNHQALRLQEQAVERGSLISAITKAVRQALQMAALAVGAALVIQHEATAGVMIGASIILSRALAPVEMAIGSWRNLVQSREAARRLNALFDRSRIRPETLALPKPRGHLSVEGLVYAPSPTAPLLLRGVSFTVQPGEALAVLGPSGAGKSSLARLLIGTRRPRAGCVRLDGADVANWERGEFGQHVGYLPQEVALFDGTVAENIARLGAASAAEIVDAAQIAGAHELILRLPQGYETRVGEQGGLLSGGQRQRIGLARALLRRPRLIVLDEPNANLDAEGEAALNQAIAAMKRTASLRPTAGAAGPQIAQIVQPLSQE
ncbi:MAG: transporter, ATPase component (Type toxin/protease secretion system) [Rhizobiaceae bacterium]|nr:transporter, ATPase component (Type toxin/protease secretion system) [Rhizobiaceae bacterium]